MLNEWTGNGMDEWMNGWKNLMTKSHEAKYYSLLKHSIHRNCVPSNSPMCCWLESDKIDLLRFNIVIWHINTSSCFSMVAALHFSVFLQMMTQSLNASASFEQNGIHMLCPTAKSAIWHPYHTENISAGPEMGKYMPLAISCYYLLIIFLLSQVMI